MIDCTCTAHMYILLNRTSVHAFYISSCSAPPRRDRQHHAHPPSVCTRYKTAAVRKLTTHDARRPCQSDDAFTAVPDQVQVHTVDRLRAVATIAPADGARVFITNRTAPERPTRGANAIYTQCSRFKCKHARKANGITVHKSIWIRLNAYGSSKSNLEFVAFFPLYCSSR